MAEQGATSRWQGAAAASRKNSSLVGLVQRLQKAAESAKDLGSGADVLPIELELGSNKLRLGEKWKLDANAASALMEELDALKGEVKRLRRDREELKKQLTETTEDKCLAEYKNQVLLEMLAVAQLDAETANADLKKEALKCDALKWELSKLSLERVG